MPQNENPMAAAIHLCWECRDTCQDTLYNHILVRGGDHIRAENIRALMDCIQICQVAVDFMRRNAALHTKTCAACAAICPACAESCASMGEEHATIQHCAEICRRCADSCHAMSQMQMAA